MPGATNRPRRRVDKTDVPGPDAGGRYSGQGRVTPKWAGWSFGLVFGILVVLGVLVLMDRYISDASATVSGYEVVDESTIRVTLAVTKPKNRDAVCIVRAKDRTGAETGHAEVRVAANPNEKTTTVRYELRTAARAVTAQVGRCLSLAPGEPLPFPEPSPTPSV